MDPKLKLKPIELIDIGIDKLTKIPIPILTDNVVSTFNIENGIPTDSFLFTFDANYNSKVLSLTITSTYEFVLNFDYGDGNIEGWIMPIGSKSISHTYSSAITYSVIATGWLDKISSIIFDAGIKEAYLNRIYKLSYLDISNNILMKLNLDGMIYLNNIILNNNYFPNDVIDDLYIQTNTFLTFNGIINTSGVNNGKPSIYSDFDRNSLIDKGWSLNYNT